MSKQSQNDTPKRGVCHLTIGTTHIAVLCMDESMPLSKKITRVGSFVSGTSIDRQDSNAHRGGEKKKKKKKGNMPHYASGGAHLNG